MVFYISVLSYWNLYVLLSFDVQVFQPFWLFQVLTCLLARVYSLHTCSFSGFSDRPTPKTYVHFYVHFALYQYMLLSTCQISPSHSHKLPLHRDKLQDLDQLEEAGFLFCMVWLTHMCDGYRQWTLWRRLWQSEKRVDLRRVDAFCDSQSLNVELGGSGHSFASWPSISRFLIPAAFVEYGCILFVLWPLNLHMHAQKGPSPHQCGKNIISTSARFSCYLFFTHFPSKIPPNGWVMCMCIRASSSLVPECASLHWGCKPPARSVLAREDCHRHPASTW